MAQHQKRTGPQHLASRARPATFAANGTADPSAEPKHRKQAVSLVHPARSVSTVVAATTAALLVTAVVLQDITPDPDSGLETNRGTPRHPIDILEEDGIYALTPQPGYAESSKVVFRQVSVTRDGPAPARVNAPAPPLEGPPVGSSSGTPKADPDSWPGLAPPAPGKGERVSQEGGASGSSLERRSEPASVDLPGTIRPGSNSVFRPVKLPPAKNWVNQALAQQPKRSTAPKVQTPKAEEVCPPDQEEQKPRVVAKPREEVKEATRAVVKAEEKVAKARETAQRATPTKMRETTERAVREKVPAAPRVDTKPAPLVYDMPKVEDSRQKAKRAVEENEDAPRLLIAEAQDEVSDVPAVVDTETDTGIEPTERVKDAKTKMAGKAEHESEKAQEDGKSSKQDVKEEAPERVEQEVKDVEKVEEKDEKKTEKVGKAVEKTTERPQRR